ncbi:hypothetical protein D3C87_1439160 [compost metagenome]
MSRCICLHGFRMIGVHCAIVLADLIGDRPHLRGHLVLTGQRGNIISRCALRVTNIQQLLLDARRQTFPRHAFRPLHASLLENALALLIREIDFPPLRAIVARLHERFARVFRQCRLPLLQQPIIDGVHFDRELRPGFFRGTLGAVPVIVGHRRKVSNLDAERVCEALPLCGQDIVDIDLRRAPKPLCHDLLAGKVIERGVVLVG